MREFILLVDDHEDVVVRADGREVRPNCWHKVPSTGLYFRLLERIEEVRPKGYLHEPQPLVRRQWFQMRGQLSVNIDRRTMSKLILRPAGVEIVPRGQ